MKNYLYFSLVLAGLMFVHAPARSQAPTNGLVAYYPFNANANDFSGNGRNGTIAGGVTATIDRLGNANQAYNFDGTTGNITIANWQSLTGNAARTMSAWFKTTVPNAYRMMISWGSIGTNLGSELGIFCDGVNQPNGLGFAAIYDVSLQIANQNQFFDSRWHLMTFTHDGSTMRLYLDGVLQAVRSNATINTTSSNLVIGSYNTRSAFFIGALDEVRIYNRALTEAEVQQMYKAEAPTSVIADVIKIGANKFIHNTGVGNSSVGLNAGSNLSSGANNTFMGFQAGSITTTGGNNVFLGANANPAGASSATLQNTVALGANAKVAISDAIVLGDTTNTNIKVGIGTAAPRYPLDVKGNVNIRRGVSGPAQLIFASRSSIHADEQDYLVLTAGRRGESGLRFANLDNQLPATATAQQFLSLDDKGRVGLYQPVLAASQVKLQTAGVIDWADHVFSNTYTQMSLNELDQFIKENRHLPHLPSAQVMTQRGATVESLIKGLVQTQEEQTKYILELQKKNEQLQRENEEIRMLLKQLLKPNSEKVSDKFIKIPLPD